MKIRSSSPTFSSSTLSQNWWKAYGDIIAGSSHRAPPSVLPYLVPSALVTSGVANAWAWPAADRLISSTPPVRLPHWSLPPNCRRTPWSR